MKLAHTSGREMYKLTVELKLQFWPKVIIFVLFEVLGKKKVEHNLAIWKTRDTNPGSKMASLHALVQKSVLSFKFRKNIFVSYAVTLMINFRYRESHSL